METSDPTMADKSIQVRFRLTTSRLALVYDSSTITFTFGCYSNSLLITPVEASHPNVKMPIASNKLTLLYPFETPAAEISV